MSETGQKIGLSGYFETRTNKTKQDDLQLLQRS